MDEFDQLAMKRRYFLSSAAFGLGALGLSQILGEAAVAASGPEASRSRHVGLAESPGEHLPTDAGGWWQYRGDQRLSGRSRIKGKIEHPAIVWSHSIAGRETLLGGALKEGSEVIRLPTVDLPTAAERAWGQILGDWQVGGLYGTSWFDLDGDGQLAGISRGYNQKVGKVLPDQPGLQLIETEAKGYPKIPNVYKGTVRLKVREKGQWVTRWETETDTLIWQAEPIFGDFDGDGKNEVALLHWYRLTLLDAATGKLKEQCNFLAEDESENPGEGGRAYGWFGAVDVDGDGQTEFVGSLPTCSRPTSSAGASRRCSTCTNSSRPSSRGGASGFGSSNIPTPADGATRPGSETWTGTGAWRCSSPARRVKRGGSSNAGRRPRERSNGASRCPTNP
jgi:hypothetical protein